MPDYQKMYALLCGGTSDALDILPDTPQNEPARLLLAQSIAQAEDIYIGTVDSDT